MIIMVLIIIVIFVVLYWTKFYPWFKTNEDKIEVLNKLVGILAILGTIVAFLMLYNTFLKSGDLELKAAKYVYIWNDKIKGYKFDEKIKKYKPQVLFEPSTIDIFCIFVNNGALPLRIDEVEVELSCSDQTVYFKSYFFPKQHHFAHYLEKEKRWEQLDVLKTEEYSHPIFIDKYSQQSFKISFKNDSFQFTRPGRYALIIKAIRNNGDIKHIIKQSEYSLNITPQKIDEIQLNRRNPENPVTEIEIIEIK
ncbi:MAG: hypothetical protein PHT41_02785 [Candidatus Omnitrophica bacterium]|nr:hypothetical protein [Candidatus Omnitrophota bacterium]MDD5237407.1 hypothetical protein [Candidatus Omnitrophota bacterium]